MNTMSRPLATLAALAAGGFGLWLAGHWDRTTNGGYWAALGVVALAGLLLGLAQLRATDGNAPGMLLLAWLPLTIVAGWVLVHEQPVVNDFRAHVRDWSADLGLTDAIGYLGPFVPVLAFAIGLVFGLTLLTGWYAREVHEAEAAEPAARPVPTRMSTPPPMVAPRAEAEAAEQETVVAGDGSRRRKLTFIP
jgi:hypothetical protein